METEIKLTKEILLDQIKTDVQRKYRESIQKEKESLGEKFWDLWIIWFVVFVMLLVVLFFISIFSLGIDINICSLLFMIVVVIILVLKPYFKKRFVTKRLLSQNIDFRMKVNEIVLEEIAELPEEISEVEKYLQEMKERLQFLQEIEEEI